jgi:hypothetical protein
MSEYGREMWLVFRQLGQMNLPAPSERRQEICAAHTGHFIDCITGMRAPGGRSTVERQVPFFGRIGSSKVPPRDEPT